MGLQGFQSQRMSDGARGALADQISATVAAHPRQLIVVHAAKGMGAGKFLTQLASAFPAQRTGTITVLPWEREQPGALLSQVRGLELGEAPILLIHDFDAADDASFQALVSAAKRENTSLIATVTSDRAHPFADQIIALPPLTMRETDQFARWMTGYKLPALLVEELYLACGGRPEFIAEVLSESPRDAWSRPDATLSLPSSWYQDFESQTADLDEATRRALYSRPLLPADLAEAVSAHIIDLEASEQGRTPVFRDPRFAAITSAATPEVARATNPVAREKLLLAKAQARAQHLDLASTELYLQDCTGVTDVTQRDTLTGFIALYGGHRKQASAFLSQRTSSPDQSSLGAVFDLACWDLESMRDRSAHTMSMTAPGSIHHEEAQIHHGFAQHVITGEATADATDFAHAISRERANLFAGWTALANDDPNSARFKLRHVPGGALSVGLWRDAALARTLYVLGQWKEAKLVVERGLSACELNGIELLEPFLLWTGAQISAMEGNDELADSYLKRMSIGGDAFLIQQLPAAMGRMIVGASVSDLPNAVHASDRLSRIAEGVNTHHPGFWPWEDVYAQTLIRAGQIDKADEVIDAADKQARGLGLTSLFAKNAVPRATILAQRGHTKKAFSLFDDAVAAIEHTEMPAYAARVLFEYGLVLRRSGRRSRADDILRRATDLFQEMDAHAMVRRCNQERRISGVGGHIQNTIGLTAQEEQVAHLAVEGTTNREIARQLAISPKTVEYHLTHVYKKLDIAGRSELAAALR